MQYADRQQAQLAGLAQVATTIVSSDAERRKRATAPNDYGKGRQLPGETNRGPAHQISDYEVGQPKKRMRRDKITVVWYKGHDLRVADHPALHSAIRRGGAVVPVFIWAPHRWSPGEAGRWWLKKSLESLAKDLAALNLQLVLRVDHSQNFGAIRDILNEVGADAVFWHRQYDSSLMDEEEVLRKDFESQGIIARSLKSELLVEPWELDSRFLVLHNYMKAWMNLPPPPMPTPHPIPVPEHCSIKDLPSSNTIQMGFSFSRRLERDFGETWTPGSTSANEKLRDFLDGAFLSFGEGRCRRDLYGTSRLSPHFKFGEVSPRQIYHAIRRKMVKSGNNRTEEEVDSLAASSRAFLKNLCSREFAYHLLYYNPAAVKQPLVSQFSVFPWSDDMSHLSSWEEGKTGYPLVDAAMRELRTTGWVHNMLRFLLASFFTKYLMLPWQSGMAKFFDLLVDGDLKSNVVGWQWSCGCNTDSLPVSSLINPVGLARKQDPTGYYVRKWIPELAGLPEKFLHCPWKAPASVLRDAGIILGVNYPAPVVGSTYARQRAKNAFLVMKRIISSQHPTRWSLIQSSEVESDLATEQRKAAEAPRKNEKVSMLWQLCPKDEKPSDSNQSTIVRPLFISPGAAVSVLNAAEVRNNLSGLTPSQSASLLGPSSQAPTSSQKNSEENLKSNKTKTPGESLSLAERTDLVRSIIQDTKHEFHTFANHIYEHYELTEDTDRLTSKHYVRLCTLRDQFYRTQIHKDERQKMTIYKMKNFFGKVLRMEVTGEWDRHNHGGVRGPYVYGIRSRSAAN